MSQADCAKAIALKAAAGEMPHVTVRDEQDGENRIRVAEAFTSTNHSPNCPEHHKRNLFVARVPYTPGERKVNNQGDVRPNEGIATEQAFAMLLEQISAPPMPEAPPPLAEQEISVTFAGLADTEPPPPEETMAPAAGVTIADPAPGVSVDK